MRFDTKDKEKKPRRELLQARQETQEKWYAGDTPSSGEVAARIYTIAEKNPGAGQQMWDAFQGFRMQPGTPLYSPYTQSTNKAVTELAKLGYDVSGGITEKWLSDNAGLQGQYRTITGMTPLAPSSKSTKEQDAAYWYYKALNAEETTQKAETEWEALQEEVQYWAGRTDRNYSDEQVLSKINWKNYPTLARMDEDRDMGTPTVLNRAVGYSRDNLQGVLWAARNDSTGDAMVDSVNAALKKGNTWKENPAITEKLDPTSPEYSPYAVGSTLDDAALYFGVQDFSANWLAENRGRLDQSDDTAMRMYEKVYNAEQTTLAAEEELAAVKATVDEWLAYTSDPDAVLSGLLADAPTLKRMDKSRASGDILPMTRAVDYRWEDIEDDVRRRCEDMNTAVQGTEYVQGLTNVLGAFDPRTDGTMAVETSRNNAINAGAPTILAQGTPEEKVTFRAGYDVDLDEKIASIDKAIKEGTMAASDSFLYSLSMADEAAIQGYIGAKAVVAPYEQRVSDLQAAETELLQVQELLNSAKSTQTVSEFITAQKDLGRNFYSSNTVQVDGGRWEMNVELDETTGQYRFIAAFNTDTGEILSREQASSALLQKGERFAQTVNAMHAPTSDSDQAITTLSDRERELVHDIAVGKEYLQANKSAYDKGRQTLDQINMSYKAAGYVADGSVDGLTARDVLDFVYEAGKDYKPTQWSAMNLYDAAVAEGHSRSTVVKAAVQGRRESLDAMEQIDTVLAWLTEKSVKVDKTYTDNLQRERDRLNRDVQAADYFLLQENDDFKELVQKTSDEVHTPNWWNPVLSDEKLAYYAKFPGANIDLISGKAEGYMHLFTDEERELYLYIYGTEGAEAAREYYNFMTDESYGAVHVRSYEDRQAVYARFASEHPAVSSALTVVASPAQTGGAVYSALAALRGKEINPYNPAFQATQFVGTSRAAVKERNKAQFDKAAPFVNFLYDAGMGTGDSLMNAALFQGIGAGGVIAGLNMGLSGSAAVAQDTKLQGATNSQALLRSGITAVVETLTESAPMENLNRALLGGDEVAAKGLIVSMLQNAGVEGLGESASSLLTGVSDGFIMGEYDKWKNAPKEEQLSAAKAFLIDVLYEGAVGFVSGGMSEGVALAAGRMRTSETLPNSTQENVEKIPPETGKNSLESIPQNAKSADFIDDSASRDTEKQQEITADGVEKQRDMDAFSRRIAALSAASATADEASVTATIGAALAPDSAYAQSISTVSTAAQHLVADLGTGKALQLMEDTLIAAHEQGITPQQVKLAVTTAALSTGQARAIFYSDSYAQDSNPQKVQTLIEAAQADLANSDTVSQMSLSVSNNQVARRVAAIVADGGLAHIQALETAVQDAQRQVEYAEDALADMVRKERTAGENLQSVYAQFLQTPTAQSFRGAVQQATNDLQGATRVVAEYEKSLDNAHANLDRAKNRLDRERDTALQTIRRQAVEEVQAAREYEAQQLEQLSANEKNEPSTLPESAPESDPKGVKEDVTTPDTLQASKDAPRGDSKGVSSARKAVKATKSPARIAKDLLSALDVGDYIGTKRMNRVSQNILGFYMPFPSYVAVRAKEAGEYTTTMHEAFHAIARKTGLTGTPGMLAHLDPAWLALYEESELLGEAFAEFGHRYMIDEASARAYAGDAFVDNFEAVIREKGLDKPVHKAAQELRIFANAGVNEQIGATIVNKSDAGKGKSIRERFREFITHNVDDTAAADVVETAIRQQNGGKPLSLEEDIRANARMRNFSARQAFALLDVNLVDPEMNVIGKSLGARLEECGVTGDDFDLFNRYGLAKHSLSRDANDAAVFADAIDTESRKQFIQQVEEEHPNIAKGFRAFQEFREEFLQAWLVDTGFLDQAIYDMLMRKYPDYMPTRRVQDKSKAAYLGNAKTYQIMAAKGATTDIINPVDSFVDMVDSIVTMVNTNKTKLAFHRAYDTYKNLGIFGRKITPDMRKESVDTTSLQNTVRTILSDNGTDMDVMDRVLDAIGTRQEEFKKKSISDMPNAISVRLPNGSEVYYEIIDTELFKLLSAQRDTAGGADKLWYAIGKVTRAMTALTTGSNPIFAVRNFMRDFQNSVNYGSWASNYATGFYKWCKAFYEVWKGVGAYEEYASLGGGGWTHIQAGTKIGANAYRRALFQDYGETGVTGKTKKVARKALEYATLAKLNEAIEQASRYAEYAYGKHDLTTETGKKQAFLAAQDVTTDFNLRGNSSLVTALKNLVPFFGASLQGVYRTGRTAVNDIRDKSSARFVKTVVNTALTSAIATALMLKFSTDEEREEFDMLSDDMKAKHIYFPNFLADAATGNRSPLIRLPLAQDPLTYAIHSIVSNGIWYGSQDEAIISLADTAQTIVDNLNPVGGTIFDPILGAMRNRTWYGSPIVPGYMEDWEPTTQYTEETPGSIVAVARWAGASPLKAQYLAEQYSGYLGQMLVPALSKNRDGHIGGLSAILSSVRRRFTSDPLVSNDIVNSVYDNSTFLTQVTTAAKNGRPANRLRRGLSEEEQKAAYQEAYDLTHAGGAIYEAKKAVSDGYDQIEQINENDTLTDAQKYALTSDVRRQMLDSAVTANEAAGAYRERYVAGMNIVANALFGGDTLSVPTALDKLHTTFTVDNDALYMQRATSVWEATGKDSALPHPNMQYTANGQEYTIAPEEQEAYLAKYKTGYQKGLVDKGKLWDGMTDEERLKVLQAAHTAGHNAAVKWHKTLHGIQ